MFKHRSTFYFVIYELFLFCVCITEIVATIVEQPKKIEIKKEEIIIIKNKNVEQTIEIKKINKPKYLPKPKIVSVEYDDADTIWYEDD